MLPYEINDTCKEAFINLVASDSQYHGRTYCYFEPYEHRSKAKHWPLVDKATGYGIVIPLAAEDIQFMDKDVLQRILKKALNPMVQLAVSKTEQSKPVDYSKNPLKAAGRLSKLLHVEKLAKVTVEIYGWSSILV